MEPDFSAISYIAYMFLNKTIRPLEVLKSNAGWYIGCKSENGELIARDSASYYPTVYQARAVLTACSWTQRRTP